MIKYDPWMYCEHANETSRGLCACGPSCACREQMCKEPTLIRNTSTPAAARFWERAERDEACDQLLANVESAFDEAKAKIRGEFMALVRSLPELPTTVLATSIPPKKARKASSAAGRPASASSSTRKKSRP